MALTLCGLVRRVKYIKRQEQKVKQPERKIRGSAGLTREERTNGRMESLKENLKKYGMPKVH